MADIDVKKLAEQLDAAQALLDEIRITSGCESFRSPHANTAQRVEAALATAERAYRDRQKRTEFVGDKEIFGEPAWDMLLDLFIRQTKEEEISVKSACINSEAPAPTALRWLNVLAQHELISLHPDATDSQKHLITLTATGYEGMLRYLESISS